MSPPPNETEGLTPQASSPLQAVVIEARGPGGETASARLERGTLRVGSSSKCDLVVSDTSVSRVHASLELERGAVTVRDHESRNGTFFLGARINQAVVPIGGEIVIGRTTLSIRPVAAPVPTGGRESLGTLVGRSEAMRRLYATLEPLARSDVNVLVLGETGTGKEEVARTLHQLSGRGGGFEVFDAGRTGAELIESELFGHVVGAFTGATRPADGVVARAGTGTLFLDEVGELPLELQPKLLRLLANREYRPVGGAAPLEARCRVVAATHRDLAAEVRAGRFREDLFHRLAVTTVQVPSLRERRDDIPLLVEHLVRERGGPPIALSRETVARLMASPWRGNVRELRNTILRVLALGEDHSVEAVGDSPGDAELPYQALVARVEADYLTGLMARHQGNVAAAARAAGLARSQLYRMLRRHQIAGYREPEE